MTSVTATTPNVLWNHWDSRHVSRPFLPVQNESFIQARALSVQRVTHIQHVAIVKVIYHLTITSNLFKITQINGNTYSAITDNLKNIISILLHRLMEGYFKKCIWKVMRLGLHDVRLKEDMSSFSESCRPSVRHLPMVFKCSDFPLLFLVAACFLSSHSVLHIL